MLLYLKWFISSKLNLHLIQLWNYSISFKCVTTARSFIEKIILLVVIISQPNLNMNHRLHTLPSTRTYISSNKEHTVVKENIALIVWIIAILIEKEMVYVLFANKYVIAQDARNKVFSLDLKASTKQQEEI